MPLIEVEIVLRLDEMLATDQASRLADATAEVLREPAGRTWVRVRSLSTDAYAEDSGGPPEGVYPVFVTVVKARLPLEGNLQTEVASLTQAIADVCDRPPENVHVIYEPKAAGRVAFGGRLVSAGSPDP